MPRTFLRERDLIRVRYEVAGSQVDEDGFPIDDNVTVTETPFRGSVQVGGARRVVGPDGTWTETRTRLLCNEETLRATDEDARIRADEVIDGTKRYVVALLEDEHPNIPHQRAFLLKVQSGVRRLDP